jgi:hypothetical protein
MPDDEPFEYLPTQAIADYLATEANPPLDGLLYPSVQGSDHKLNVVLFHNAARVERLDVPKGTHLGSQLSTGSEDDTDVDYRVWEEVPSVESSVPLEANGAELGLRFPIFSALSIDVADDYDERIVSLKLDIASLQVRHVVGVEFRTHSYPVHRHRIDSLPPPL